MKTLTHLAFFVPQGAYAPPNVEIFEVSVESGFAISTGDNDLSPIEGGGEF